LIPQRTWEFVDPGNKRQRRTTAFQIPAFGTYTVKLTVATNQMREYLSEQVTLVNELLTSLLASASVCNNETFTIVGYY
jgi:hypothetical protein